MGCKCESDGHTESNWKAKTHSAKVVCMAHRIDAKCRKCCTERDETRSKSTSSVNFREIPRYGRNCRKGLQENGVRRLYRETRRKTPRRKERRRDRRKKERRQESEGKTETRKQDEITRRSGREAGFREASPSDNGILYYRRPTRGIHEAISRTSRTGWSFPKEGANVSKIPPPRETSKSWCKVDPGHPFNANVSRGSALRREARMARDIR